MKFEVLMFQRYITMWYVATAGLQDYYILNCTNFRIRHGKQEYTCDKEVKWFINNARCSGGKELWDIEHLREFCYPSSNETTTLIGTDLVTLEDKVIVSIAEL